MTCGSLFFSVWWLAVSLTYQIPIFYIKLFVCNQTKLSHCQLEFHIGLKNVLGCVCLQDLWYIPISSSDSSCEKDNSDTSLLYTKSLRKLTASIRLLLPYQTKCIIFYDYLSGTSASLIKFLLTFHHLEKVLTGYYIGSSSGTKTKTKEQICFIK